jgi:hypothetical protein
VRTDPAHVRGNYQQRFAAWQLQLRQECRRRLIDLVEMTTETPLEKALLAYLRKRGRLF